MKKIALLTFLAATAAATFALPPMDAGRMPALAADDILAAAPGIADKTPDQLTIGERLAVAGAVSVAMQKAAYVRRAAVASFMLPGAGQWMTGDYGSGALHLGAQAAIMAGGLAAIWYLSPADLRDLTLGREKRMDLMRSYFTLDRIGQILPSMGVAAAGMTLSLIDRVLAAKGARAEAQTNLDSGKVKIEPRLSMMGGLGIGMILALR